MEYSQLSLLDSAKTTISGLFSEYDLTYKILNNFDAVEIQN